MLPRFKAYQPHSSLHRRPGVYDVADVVWYDHPITTSDGGVTGEVFFKGYDSSEFLEEVKLMQATGLPDKKGEEIFSGHIVKFKLGNEWCFGAVEYDKDSARFIKRFKSSYGEECKDLSSYAGTQQIVGTVYENPELLR